MCPWRLPWRRWASPVCRWQCWCLGQPGPRSRESQTCPQPPGRDLNGPTDKECRRCSVTIRSEDRRQWPPASSRCRLRPDLLWARGRPVCRWRRLLRTVPAWWSGRRAPRTRDAREGSDRRDHPASACGSATMFRPCGLSGLATYAEVNRVK